MSHCHDLQGLSDPEKTPLNALSGSEAATAQTKIWQPKDVPTVSPFLPSDFFRVFWILSELPTPHCRHSKLHGLKSKVVVQGICSGLLKVGSPSYKLVPPSSFRGMCLL